MNFKHYKVGDIIKDGDHMGVITFMIHSLELFYVKWKYTESLHRFSDKDLINVTLLRKDKLKRILNEI